MHCSQNGRELYNLCIIAVNRQRGNEVTLVSIQCSKAHILFIHFMHKNSCQAPFLENLHLSADSLCEQLRFKLKLSLSPMDANRGVFISAVTFKAPVDSRCLTASLREFYDRKPLWICYNLFLQKILLSCLPLLLSACCHWACSGQICPDSQEEKYQLCVS